MSSVEKGDAHPDIVVRWAYVTHHSRSRKSHSRRENVAIAVSICTPRLL